MFRLVGNATIGNVFINGLNNITFSDNWEDLAKKGEMKIPNNLKLEGKPIITQGTDSLFKRGDKVSVVAGYFPNQIQIFNGFISDIKPTTPISFKIEDYFFLLKQISIKYTFRKVNLKNLLLFLESEFKKKFPNESLIFKNTVDIELSNFRINNASISEVFDKLRDFGLFTFIRENTLYCGLAVIPSIQKTHDFYFERDIISDNLVYNKKDDQKIKLVAISINIQNEKIEVQVGDDDGEQRTLHFYNLSKKDLEGVANREIERYKYEGLKGNFETFGEKIVNHGDIVNLVSKKYPYKNGKYLVKNVDVSVGVDGYRQTITLDKKIQ